MTDVELWLKQDGKIEQINNHDDFSVKIRHNPRKWYNVIIMRGLTLISYSISWKDNENRFIYQALVAKTTQVEKAINVARLLRSVI